jgi:hypothetical protein
MNEHKSIKSMIEKLLSKNTEEVLFTLNQIRNSGNPAILPNVVELLNSTKSMEIKASIVQLLNDLKIQSATSEIINALKNNQTPDTQKILLTSIWQSGLNYSEHIGFFVDMFISGDFEIAFEAFTIIENMEQGIRAEILDPLVARLKQKGKEIEKEKTDLYVELVHILERKNLE